MISPFTLEANVIRRIAYAMMAMLMVVAVSPIFQPRAGAAQLSARSIQLSDSGPSGGTITSGVGSGTAVTYQVTFTASFTDGGSGGANSIVIDFCQENPIIGDTCTAPTGLDVDNAVLGTTVAGNVTTANGWAVDATLTTASRVALKDDDTTNFFGAAQQRFNLTTITNPSTTGSFYARILTFNNNTFGTYTSAISPGNYDDYGGVALSTVAVITISARVQEQLTFCLTAASPTTWTTQDCSTGEVAANPPAVVLGHGAPTPTLDDTAVDTASVYSQLSTNATSGAVINLRSSRHSCGTNPGGLSADGGTTCNIPPHNAGSGAGASVMTAGTAAFGLYVSNSYLGTNGVGTITSDPGYHDNTNCGTDGATNPCPSNNGITWYGMDSTTAAANGTGPSTNVGNVTTTFGDIITSSTAPTYRARTTYTFAATASLTTPAGIYTANLSLIATGTF